MFFFLVFYNQFLSEINKIVSILRKLSIDYDLIKKNKDFDINKILIRLNLKLNIQHIFFRFFFD